MPVTFEWLDEERTIALTTMSGGWTWDEFGSISQQYREDLKTINHPVYEIIVFDQMARSWLPPNAISYGRNLLRSQPDNIIMSIAVTRNTFLRNMINMLMNLTQSSYKIAIVGTLDEAHALIAERKQDAVQE